MGQDFIDVKIRTNGPFPIPAICIFRSGDAFVSVWLGGYFSGIHPNIGRHVERTTMSIVIDESIDIGSILNGFGKINILPFLLTLIRFGPVPTKMPFTNHLGVVSRLLEQVGDSGTFCGNQMLACSAKYSACKSRSPIVATGKHSISCGCANSTGRMGIHKGNSFIRHLLKMRSLDFTIRISRRHIANSQIVSKDEDHIRTSMMLCVKEAG